LPAYERRPSASTSGRPSARPSGRPGQRPTSRPTARPQRGRSQSRPAPAAPIKSELEIGLDAAAEASALAADEAVPTFTELGLPERLITALNRRGVTAPFAIQARALPDAIAGRDVLGRAQTGSGKTLAFGLPMLARLAGTPRQP
jgi:ATP-dependent helicase YprA (DUF1998 family)